MNIEFTKDPVTYRALIWVIGTMLVAVIGLGGAFGKFVLAQHFAAPHGITEQRFNEVKDMIVSSENRTNESIMALEKRTNSSIKTLENRTNASIKTLEIRTNDSIAEVRFAIRDLDQRLTARLNATDKRLDDIFGLLMQIKAAQ